MALKWHAVESPAYMYTASHGVRVDNVQSTRAQPTRTQLSTQLNPTPNQGFRSPCRQRGASSTFFGRRSLVSASRLGAPRSWSSKVPNFKNAPCWEKVRRRCAFGTSTHCNAQR